MHTTHIPPDKKVTSYLFDNIDIDFLKQVIHELNKTDLKTTEFNQVKEVIDLLMEGYRVRLMGLRPPALYRARKGNMEDSFHNVSELWYPPKDFVGMGRLNKEKQSIFYCSDDQNVALLEVRPTPKEKVTILQCVINDDYHLRLLPIGIQRYLKKKHLEFDKIPFEDELPEHSFPNNEDFLKNELIHEYFIEQLTKIVESGNESAYSTTVAMSMNYLNELNNIDGILYPSVAAKLTGKNLVLKPEIADKYMTPIAAWEYYVDKEIEPMTYECICTKSSKAINDGEIIWE